MSQPDDFSIEDDWLEMFWEDASNFEAVMTPEEVAWERACAVGTNEEESSPIYIESLLAHLARVKKANASSWEPQKSKPWYNRLIGR